MSRIVPIPAVNTALINSHGEILLSLRSKTVREPLKWCLPGGHLEIGETWQDGARRETLEELGIKTKNEIFCGVYSDPAITVTQDVMEEGFRGQYVVAVFIAKEWEGEFKPNDEVEDYDWFSLDNLPEPIIRSHPIRAIDALNFKGVPFVR